MTTTEKLMALIEKMSEAEKEKLLFDLQPNTDNKTNHKIETQNEDKTETDIKIIDYTEKSIVVIGNTTEYKEKLKEIGGKWNSRLKHPDTKEQMSGWIFPKTKIENVKKIV